MSCISDAVTEATRTWIKQEEEGADYNIVDVFNLAEKLGKLCNLTLDSPNNILPQENAALLVELVDKELQDHMQAIRCRTTAQLTNDLTKVGQQVLKLYPEFGSIEKAIMKSLYIWVGCFQIDKSCRKFDANNKPFDRTRSLAVHQNLVDRANENAWIKLGFSSAKYFRQYEKDKKNYDWIPEDSPYRH
jgi:hypothetical protein